MDVNALPPSQLPLFYGFSGEECAHFVHTMWVVGEAAGKATDSDWMLSLAKSSFVGDAAEWFERRHHPAREGWRELARALFDHWSIDRLENNSRQHVGQYAERPR